MFDKPNMIYRTFISIIILFTFSGFNQGKPVIMFFGDSLTAGHGLSPDQAFPNLIQERINRNDLNYKVINAGLSGETSAGGLARIDWVLRQPVDIFVLELGANDGLRGVPVSETKKNLQGIIDKVKSKYPEAQIVIAGMMVPPNMGESYSKQFRQMFKELASENDAMLIPFLLEGVGGNEQLNLPDGIHPNIEGHKVVAENVWQVLQPIL